MTDTSFYMIIDFFILAYGIYVLYQCIWMIRTGKLQQNMTLPKDLDVNKCKDSAGYIRFIGKKQLLFGLATVICGAIGLAQDATGVYDMYLGIMVIFILLCIWYGWVSRQATQKFW